MCIRSYDPLYQLMGTPILYKEHYQKSPFLSVGVPNFKTCSLKKLIIPHRLLNVFRESTCTKS